MYTPVSKCYPISSMSGSATLSKSPSYHSPTLVHLRTCLLLPCLRSHGSCAEEPGRVCALSAMRTGPNRVKLKNKLPNPTPPGSANETQGSVPSVRAAIWKEILGWWVFCAAPVLPTLGAHHCLGFLLSSPAQAAE